MNSSNTMRKDIIHGNTVLIDAIKSVDKRVAAIGDVLTYTVNLTNTGNVAANNIIFTDKIPNGAKFVLGSLTINGEPQVVNPEEGINVGSIIPGAIATIIFRVTVIAVPVPNEITSTANATFQFTSDPTLPAENGNTRSNTVNTQVNNANVAVTKVVDKQYVDVGDTLNYTVTLNNLGNIEANNIIFKESILEGTSFDPNSLSIDGVYKSGVNPTLGVNIGSIPAEGTIVVTFRVHVDMIPVINPIQSAVMVVYEFIVDETKPPVNREIKSNEVTTMVNSADIDVVKKVDKECVTFGDILTFNYTITNKGNVEATNVVFKDLPPYGTNFVINSFAINGVLKHGSNPIKGIDLEDIPAGGIVTLSFDVVVDSIPDKNQKENPATLTFNYRVDTNKPLVEESKKSNNVDIRINVARLVLDNSVNKTEAVVGDTLTYNVIIKNAGNINVEDVIFNTRISEGATLVKGSLLINSIPYPTSNIDTDINIGTMEPGLTVDITFSVKIKLRPIQATLKNTCVIDFKCIVDPKKSPLCNTILSNETVTSIEEVKIEAINVADKVSVLIGDIITYSITITNLGTITVKNLSFRAQIPEGTSLITNSIVPIANDPSVGVYLGDILAGKSVTASFKVKIDFIPYQLRLLSKALIDFEYGINGEVIKESIWSNLVSIDASPSNFKQLYINSEFKISDPKPEVYDILGSVVDIEIMNTYPIKTMKGISFEGQTLTGNKLIIQGRLKEKIEYTTADETHSVHVARFDTQFSTFIIVPECFKDGMIIDVEGIVEDVHIKLIDKRTIFESIIFRLIAKLR